MPLANPTSQPIKKPAFFDRSDTEAIANFIETQGGGPTIPSVTTSGRRIRSAFIWAGSSASAPESERILVGKENEEGMRGFTLNRLSRLK